MKAEALAPAKVNLALHVTGRRPDSYHLLDSLVAFADVGDRISIEPAAADTIEIGGEFAAGVPADARNLVVQALHLTGRHWRVTLDKRLPHPAGLGGGSSDAAAALRLASRMTGEPLPQGLDRLGADIPVCVLGRAARMTGIGEILSPLEAFPRIPAVLVNPGVAVPTAAAFRALETTANPALPALPGRFRGPRDLADWLALSRNDLQKPALQIAPAIGDALAALSARRGCLIARMSGSGASCFALYAEDAGASAAAASIAAAHPRWWVRATTLS
jgi:4-diphosphocytidyl-2-C-methyl-D-erythritol kinase